MDDTQLSSIAKALAHPARLRIVRLLAQQNECRGSDVFAELPLAQSTISQHLSVLRDAGVISSHPAGTGMVYCLNPDSLNELANELVAFATEAASCGAEGTQC